MPIDRNLIIRKLNELKNVPSLTAPIWKPPVGNKTTIRILPNPKNPSYPFHELYFHYNFNGKTYLSPISVNKIDPILEFSKKLKQSGNEQEIELAKKLVPKLRIYAAIIVRGKESEGVKFWGFGKEVYIDLLSMLEDSDIGDYTDPLNGYDLIVECDKVNENTLPRTSVRIKPNPSPLSKNENEYKQWIDNQPDIFDIFKLPSTDELKEALKLYIENASIFNEEVHEEKITKKVETVKEEKNSVKNTANDFKKLFNEDIVETVKKPADTGSKNIKDLFDDMDDNIKSFIRK